MFSSEGFLRSALIPLLLTSAYALPQATFAGAVEFESYSTAAAASSAVSVAANASSVAADAGVVEPGLNGAAELAVTTETIATNVAATLAPVKTASYGKQGPLYCSMPD